MITSLQNPKIKQIIKLRKTGARKKEGVVVVEGVKEISLAIEAGLEISQLFFSHSFNKKGLDKKYIQENTELIEVEGDVFQKISLRENPDGHIALVKPKNKTLKNISLSKNPLIVVLDELEKPGNLGAIMRTCDAAGVDAIIMTNKKVDIYNPNVIRASLGTVFTNQVILETRENTIDWLKENKISILTTTPSTNFEFTEVDFALASAIVIGTEHSGLPLEWLDKADKKIKIPMLGKIDSLNASVSAAVVIYEAVRQRKKQD